MIIFRVQMLMSLSLVSRFKDNYVVQKKFLPPVVSNAYLQPIIPVMRYLISSMFNSNVSENCLVRNFVILFQIHSFTNASFLWNSLCEPHRSWHWEAASRLIIAKVGREAQPVKIKNTAGPANFVNVTT